MARLSIGTITIFDSVGFATEDFSTLRYLRDRTEGTDLYVELALLAEPTDPRNLFGVVTAAVTPAEAA